MNSTRKILLCLAVLAITTLAYTSNAQAQCGSSYGSHGSSFGSHGSSFGSHGYSHGGSSISFSFGGHSRRTPVYHRPSVHIDRVYHADRLHYTPRRGLHTHGHYDAVPHYTPGHFDTLHRGHVDLNRRYHH